MDKTLAIVSNDSVYAHTLSEYIKNSQALNYRILTFFDVTKYVSYKEKNKVAVGLVDESLAGEISNKNEELRLLLTEKRKEGSSFVFKYQALDVLIKEVGFKAHSYVGNGEHLGIKCMLVGGVRGGAGESCLSLCVAGATSFSTNTLFLSLDPFLVLPKDMLKGEGDISELIYALKVKGENFLQQAAPYIRHGKDFDYLVGVHCFEDFYSLGKTEVKNFFLGLGKSGRYDCLVVDLGSFPPGTEVFLDRCETFFLIGEEDDVKTELFINGLVRLMGKTITEKLNLAKLPMDIQFQNGIPTYNEFDNTVMFSFAKELLKKRKRSLEATDNFNGIYNAPRGISAYEAELSLEDFSRSYERRSIVNQKVMEDNSWNQDEKSEKKSKFSIKRLVEKGLSEGLNG